MTNLVGLEILYEKTLYPELEYIFKHALIQEVAYESLLKQRRQEIHGRVAQTIEELYADRIDEHYESLAHHYEQSGNDVKAVNYLILAGEKSNQIGAVQAAYEFLEKAQKISDEAHILLDTEKEVRLNYGLAVAQTAIGGMGFAVNGLRRAVDLSRRNGMVDYEKMSLGFLIVCMLFWLDQEEAECTIDEGIIRARELADKGLESRVLSIKAAWAGSYNQRDKSFQMIIEAEKLALASKDPYAINQHGYWRGQIERWLGRPRKAIEYTEALLDSMSESFNITQFFAISWQRGVTLAEIGRIEDGMAILKACIDICEKYGARAFLGTLYNCLGYCYIESFQFEQAWKNNLKSEKIIRPLFVKFSMARGQLGHALAQVETNLIENLIEQGKLDKAWERIKKFEEEANSKDFYFTRYQWESRLKYNAAQVLLKWNDLDQAEAIILANLDQVRSDLMKKREGGFLRLLGELRLKRNEIDNAIMTLNNSIQVLREVGNPRQLWLAHSSLASAFKETGRHSEAHEQWGAASDIIQHTADGLSDRELREGFLNAHPIREILLKVVS